MSKKDHLEKWDLSHLKEMVQQCLKGKYSGHVMMKNGDLIFYKKKPKFFARMLNATETISFRDIISEIWLTIYGNDLPLDDLAKLFMTGSKQDLLELTYYLYVASRVSEPDIKRNVSSRNNEPKTQYVYTENNERQVELEEEYNVGLSDGVYNIQKYVISKVHRQVPIETILQSLRENRY